MPGRGGSKAGLLLIGILAVVGAQCGLCLGFFGLLAPAPPPPTRESFPFPHHIPKTPGNVTLRFAMVHDVLHERFPRHGKAYYAERNRRVRPALDELKAKLPEGEKSPERYWALLDDLGVGLEFVGEHDEAIRVMRDKLRRQEALGMQGRELYSSYANLGTFLILGPFRQVRPGNEDDKRVLREGLDLVHKSIEVNPEAHFGREVWQAVIIEYMLAAYDDPELVLKFDMVGNRLDRAVDAQQGHAINNLSHWGGLGLNRSAAAYLGQPVAGADTDVTAKRLREFITTVGAEEGWADAVKSSHQKPVPFDEPCLGIIGMWRLGGGAHPYFAVALGETMLRVGQRYLAWCAFERAARIAQHVWPDAVIQDRFVEHCRRRQAVIDEPMAATERQGLRVAFEMDMANGLAHQQAYQRYEEERIAAGASLDDPHFYDDFHATHEPIASKVGEEDAFVVERAPTTFSRVNVPLILLFAGLFAFVAACVWWHANR